MKRLALILCATVLYVPTPVEACGASLFGVGQGMRFRSYRAPHPAKLLLFHDESLRARSGGNATAFERALERAGHDVTVVESDADLDRALAGTSYDVLIADFEAMQPLVVAQAASASSHPSLLPIVHDDTGLERANEEGYSRVLSPKTDYRQLLRAINDLMKGRLK